jgi:Zn-dependent protease
MEILPFYLMRFFVLTVSLSFHEAAHAWTANRLGDDTAKRLGRLSLNPLVHMDPVGSLMMLTGMPLGWAKPVPVNPYNLNNPRTGMPLVSFAGPLSNLFLALIACIIYFLVGERLSNPGGYLMLKDFILINLSLAIFNLLPIAPLDGSKIITTFMSDRVADIYEEKVAAFGMFPLIAIVIFESVGSGYGVLDLWFRFWKPLIYPILALFNVPYQFYPG